MALPSHWLDAVFTNGTEGFEQRLLKHARFKLASEKAAVAFRETQLTFDENQGICGAGPDQAARCAFLDALNAGMYDGDVSVPIGASAEDASAANRPSRPR